MKCSGCGKNIPFSGDVCPYCQRDKSNDQTQTVACAIFGLPLAYAGYKFFGLWGAVGGLFIGIVLAMKLVSRKASEPPTVKVSVESPKIKEDTSDEIRLMKLKSLFDQGLIDAGEFNKKKSEILDSM